MGAQSRLFLSKDARRSERLTHAGKFFIQAVLLSRSHMHTRCTSPRVSQSFCQEPCCQLSLKVSSPYSSLEACSPTSPTKTNPLRK